MDGGAWWAAVHGVAEGRTRLSDFTLIFTFMHWRRKWQPTPVFLPRESQGWGSLVGCRLWGATGSDTLKQLSSSSSSSMFHFQNVSAEIHGSRLSLWSGSTDSKTLGSTKWWELTQRKPLEYKTQHHPTTSSTLWRTPHPNNKQKNTNPVISRQDYHLTQPCPSEEKQTNKQKKLGTNLTLYKAYTNHCTNHSRAETKRRKNSTLKPEERRPQTQ